METDTTHRETMPGGVTFWGSVTFGGPMFDIHDNEHVYIGMPAQAPAREERDRQEPGTMPGIPDELATAEARTYWKRLHDRGFTDADGQLLPTTTRKQAMYIADLFAERLQLKAKWKPFEAMWSIRNLAQEKWNIQQTGSLPARYKEIEAVFDE